MSKNINYSKIPRPQIQQSFIVKVSLGLLIVLLSFCLVAKKDSTNAHDGVEHEVVITMYDDFYEPKNVSVEVGTDVTFINAGQEQHWPASDIHPTHAILPEFDSLEGLAPGEEYTHSFAKPGLWRYHDHLFPNIVGLITVTGDETETTDSSDGALRSNACLCALKKAAGWVTGIFTSNNVEEGADLLNNNDQIAPYIEEYGLEKTVLRVRSQVNIDAECHTVAHVIGRTAFEILGNEVFRAHVPECLSGTIHGATEGFFKKNGTNNIEEDVNIVCSGEQNRFNTHQCYHGIGHGLMAWSTYEIHDALNLCSSAERNIDRESCYSGVFMENVVGGLSGDSGHTTSYLSDDPHMPCNVVDEEYIASCYGYQSSRMVQLAFSSKQEDLDTPKRECAETAGKNDYRSICYWSLGRDIHAMFANDPLRIYEECTDQPYYPKAGYDCTTGAVSMMVWVYEDSFDSIEFCKIVEDNSIKDGCYDVIINQIGQLTTDTDNIFLFCDQLESSFIEQCYEVNQLT